MYLLLLVAAAATAVAAYAMETTTYIYIYIYIYEKGVRVSPAGVLGDLGAPGGWALSSTSGSLGILKSIYGNHIHILV